MMEAISLLGLNIVERRFRVCYSTRGLLGVNKRSEFVWYASNYILECLEVKLFFKRNFGIPLGTLFLDNKCHRDTLSYKIM